MGKFVYQLTGISSIPASTWTIYYRAYKGNPVVEAHADVDILVRMANGTVRTNVATDAANSGALTTSWSILFGTYSWTAYTVVDQNDFLEIDFYIEVTAIKAGNSVYLRIDDNTLAVTDQTRTTNICILNEQTMEVEFTGSSNMYTWAQLVWSVDSAWTTENVTVTLQLYNNTLDAYPISGNGFISYTSSATANTDETKTQTITSNPQHFRDSAGNWKIKVKGVKSTSTPFDFRADWIELKPTYYSEYSASTEFLFSSMTTNTPAQLNFTVVSEHDVSSVSVTIQVWNYSSSSYVTTGAGYLGYISSGVNETKSLSLKINPQSCTLNGNAKIKITSVLSTTTQYQQKINQVKLLYSYVGANLPPIASFSFSPSSPIVNKSVTFDASASYDQDGSIISYRWDFGDGNVTTVSLSTITHVYASHGTFPINLTVTDNGGLTGSYIKSMNVSAQTSLRPFDWLTALLFIVPVLFGLLFLLGITRKRKRRPKPQIEKETDAFSQQFGMTHQQMTGKKMLLEIDPTSKYHKVLSSFVSEARNNSELLFIQTNKNSALHSTLSEANDIKFLLLTPKASSPQQINENETLLPASDLSVLLDAFVRIQKSETEKTTNLLLDNISDIILRCGFEKTYKFTRFLLETISSAKTTALFVFNPTAHDQVISSSIRGLFQNQFAYTKNGPKVGTL